MECDKIMDFDSVRININELNEKLLRLKDSLNIDDKKNKLNELEKLTLESGFFEDFDMSKKVLSDMKYLKDSIEKVEKLQKNIAIFLLRK
jgi:hypothetical protein